MTIYFLYALVVGALCSLLVFAGFAINSKRFVIIGMVFSAIVASPIITFTRGTAGAVYASDLVGFSLLVSYLLFKNRGIIVPITPRWYKIFFIYMMVALFSAVFIAPIALSNLAETGLAQKVASPVPGVPVWLLMTAFRVVRILLFFAFFMVICHMSMDEKTLDFVLKTTLVSIVILSICQIVTFLGIKNLAFYLPWEIYQRAHILGHPKAAAGRLYVMGIFLAMAVMYKSWKASLYFVYLVIVVLALLFSGSRAALVGMLVGFVVIVWKADLKFKIAALVLLALLPVGFMVLMQVAPERIASFSEITANPSENARWQIWSWTIQTFLSNPAIPIFGVGFTNFRYALFSTETFMEIEHAHNDYLTCVTEMGFLGLGIFVFYLLSLSHDVFLSAKFALGKYRWQAVCMASILAGFLVCSLFEYSLYYSVGGVPMQRIFGIIFGAFSAYWVQQDAMAECEDCENLEDYQMWQSEQA